MILIHDKISLRCGLIDNSFCGQITAVHVGHDHIRHQQVDLSVMFPRARRRLRSGSQRPARYSLASAARSRRPTISAAASCRAPKARLRNYLEVRWPLAAVRNVYSGNRTQSHSEKAVLTCSLSFTIRMLGFTMR